MHKIDILVVLICVLVVTSLAAVKFHNTTVKQSSSDKALVFEVCNPNFCYEQMFYDVKKWEKKTDTTGRQFIRLYFHNQTQMDFDVTNKTFKVKK